MSMLRMSTPAQEGVMRVSKWLKHQVLLDVEELRELFCALGAFEIFIVSEPVFLEKARVNQEEFLSLYDTYIGALKQGKIPEEKIFRPLFSSIFTVSLDALYGMVVRDEQILIKAIKPVLQLQAHHFFVSTLDGKFHPMVLSHESITWGLQFSYPQLFQDPHTQEFSKVQMQEKFPNTALYKRLAKWLRGNTLPTPFIHQGKKSHEPIRLGKACFAWINKHPGFNARDLVVSV